MPGIGRNSFSSLGRSIEAYQPIYAPPVAPQSAFIEGGSTMLSDIRAYGVWDQHSRMVNRDPRRLGIRTLFSYGASLPGHLFRMIATGTVESSKFQPLTNHMWTGEFNDALFQAGYPRNLGLTEKVPTIKKSALGTAPWQMQPAPQFKRSIFVNRRAYNSGIPGVPATPTNGMHS